VIEFLLADRCTGCGECVKVCPAFVFDNGPEGRPVIARAGDCQTCFMCELHCQADALYVGPEVESAVGVAAAEVRDRMGNFRRWSGWHEFADDPRYSNEHWRMEEVFLRARG
jgi:NAD-dependent dihydropyrimidine dehydrogenase PreA subunit